MTLTAPHYSISEVAGLTGLSTHTLRYYERAGLMLEPIDRVSEYVDLARAGESTIPDRLELLLLLLLLLLHRISVMAQLAVMTESLAAIDFKIATYQGRTPNE